ncbi:MAG: alpha/beta fold hydrolase [Faecalibacterium sp.]
MNKRRKLIIQNNEISKLYTFNLGGFNQKVLIEGKKKEFPIVINLHGGPGSPIPFSVGCRGMFPEFTDELIMVYLDQYGCGINNAKIDDTFCIDTFVKMTEDLVQEIKNIFPNNPIYMFATSWGSILSAKILETPNCNVDGVVVWGQIIKSVFFNEEVYSELQKSEKARKHIDAIKNTDIKNITNSDLKLVSSCIKKYTDGYTNKNGETAPMGDVIKGLLTSPDYKFRDFKAIMVNGYSKNLSLWKEILQVDLEEALKNIQVPYMIIQGDTDIVASTTYVQKTVEHCQNPNLTCTIVKDSGHFPGTDGMNMVLEKARMLETGR